jgi:uncharacterized membrane protein
MPWQVTLPPVTNRETWTDTFSLIDTSTGEAYDLTNVSAIVLEVRDPNSRRSVLTASLDDGVTIEDDDEGSFISIRFESSSMRNLCARQYEFGMVITKDDDDLEVIGLITVLDGITS